MTHKTVPNLFELDAIAWKIIEGLQQNARQSFAELGQKIGLSTPAVAERVHRLEDAGVITGYHASLNMAKLGVPIRVLVRLTIPGGDCRSAERSPHSRTARDQPLPSHYWRRVVSSSKPTSSRSAISRP